MWLFLKDGYYSIVQKPEDGQLYLTIRTRNLEDAEAMKERLEQLYPYSEPEWEIKSTPNADYPYRLRATRTALADVISHYFLKGLRYSNFKATIPSGRSAIYHDIWSVLLRLSKVGQARQDKWENGEPEDRSYNLFGDWLDR